MRVATAPILSRDISNNRRRVLNFRNVCFVHVRHRDLNFIYFIKNFLAKHQTVRVVEDGEIMRHINKMQQILSFVFMEANDSENVKKFITIFSYLNSKYFYGR